MAQRLYFGDDADRKWLESTRAMLQAERALGKRTTLIIAAGVKTEKKVEVNVRSCLFEIEHDLCVRWPDDYDASVLMPIKSARVRYLYN
jgi:hypothetical protein